MKGHKYCSKHSYPESYTIVYLFCHEEKTNSLANHAKQNNSEKQSRQSSIDFSKPRPHPSHLPRKSSLPEYKYSESLTRLQQRIIRQTKMRSLASYQETDPQKSIKRLGQAC